MPKKTYSRDRRIEHERGSPNALPAAAELLSPSALLSQRISTDIGFAPRPSEIESLILEHGWTPLRAWRHLRQKTKSEIAWHLGVHLSTYEVLEEGEVDVGLWVLPALEMSCSSLQSA